jgi:hypothetical protein
MNLSNTIICPKCQHTFDANTQLQQQIEADIQQKYHQKLAEKDTEYQQQEQKFQQRLNNEKKALHQQVKGEQQVQVRALEKELSLKSAQLKAFNQAKADITRLQREKDEQQETIEAALIKQFNQQSKQDQKILRDKITSEMKSEISGQLSSLEQALSLKSIQLKELNQTKADLVRLKREKEELSDEIILEKEREFSDKLITERAKIQQKVDEISELKVKELQKKLDDQKALVVEMNRKAEQGSTQLQGEVQELAIEEWLAAQFPLDTIEEIKKGARGADCLQIVHTQVQQNCGMIYYESKRTKEFQVGWIEKFKNDIREKNALLGVLVTEAMPKEMTRMGLKEGVWICSFDEFKGLSAVLRETVIKLSAAVASQENKGDKMEMLYSYLTGNEFKLQVEGIVEGFTQMQEDLEKEKRSMARIWKQREKQLQKVVLNTTHMYGSVKGIAGKAVASVPLLEFE